MSENTAVDILLLGDLHSYGILIVHAPAPNELGASKQDLDLTIRLMEAGKLMEIQLLDHFVITGEAYLSMAEDDLI